MKRPASSRGEVDDIADRISYLNITNPLRLRTDRQAKFNLLLSRLKEVSPPTGSSLNTIQFAIQGLDSSR